MKYRGPDLFLQASSWPEETSKEKKSLAFRYTGNPIIDSGISSLLIMAGKEIVSDITDYDVLVVLRRAVEHISYEPEKFREILAFAFTRNAFQGDNEAFIKNVEKKLIDFVSLVLSENLEAAKKTLKLSFMPKPGTKCAFFPEKQAVIFASRDIYPTARARDQIPSNFIDMPGVPISLEAYIASLLHIFTSPLLWIKGQGSRILSLTINHGAEESEILNIHRQLFNDIQKNKSASFLEGYKKTFLVHLFNKLSKSSSGRSRSFTILLYNNDLRKPKCMIHQIPPILEEFLLKIQYQAYRDEANKLIKHYWKVYDSNTTQDDLQDSDSLLDTGNARNKLNLFYEALFDASNNRTSAIKVIRLFQKYMFVPVGKYIANKPEKGNIANQKHTIGEQPRVWRVLSLFVKYFLPYLKKEQLNKVREIAQKAKDLLSAEGKKGENMSKNILGVRNVTSDSVHKRMRFVFKQLNYESYKKYNKVLISFDDFLYLFDNNSWSMMFSFFQIALLEELYEIDFFTNKQRELLSSNIDNTKE